MAAAITPASARTICARPDRRRCQSRFLRCLDLAAFITLKRDWPSIKQRLDLK